MTIPRPLRGLALFPALAICLWLAGTGLSAEDSRDRIESEMTHAIAHVAPWLERYGYPALFAAVLVEGMGIPAPGQSLIMAASLSAARGNLSIGWGLSWGLAAAVLGNSLGYLIGLKGGRPLLMRLRVNEERLEKTEKRFARAGAGILLVARFVDGLRQINGIAAGLLKMPAGTFTVFNALGAVLWVGLWGMGTYFLETEFLRAHVTLQQAGPWIGGAILVASGLLLAYVLRRRNNHGHR
jgi:membrane protein DedA with SNARE-associated domain